MVAVCGLLALVSGCTALRLAYSSAPELMYWWLDRYAQFDDTQKPQMREALGAWFVWHRRTQMPDYAQQLTRARVEVMADTTAARACEWQGEVGKRFHVAFDQAAPAIADVLLTVKPEQVKSIERRHAKANADYRDEYLQADAAKRAEKTLDRTIERMETLYGSLDDAQRGRVSELLAKSPFDPEVWLAERQLRQQEATQLIRKMTAERANREQARTALQGYMERVERSPREAYRRYAQRLSEFNCAVAADMHNRMSTAQRRHAAQKLAGWESDLRAIAGAAEVASK